MSLFETGSYLASSSRRPAVPSLFVRVFAVGVATHILAYTASAIDLWLHAVTSTVVQPTSVPVNEPFQFSVAQNTCLPYVPPAAGAFAWPCLLAITRGSWGYGIGALTPGMQVMSNNSGVLQTITLADADDLAVLVDPSAPTNVSFTATTFGARARCDSVNPRCTSPETFNVTCKDVPARFPPLNVTDFDLSDSLSKMSVLSSACDTCPYVNESEYSNGAVTYKTGAPPPQNNYSLWLELIWRNQGSESFDGASKTAADAAYTAFSSEAYMFANCTLLFYNVTLEYANGAYTRAAEVLADAGLADGLVGPTRLGLYGSRLLDNLEGIVFGGNSTAHVMAYLNQDLARLALGSAAYVTNLKGPTLAQSVLSRRILGRYPAWPAVLYVVVLWANAVFPLTVSLVAMLTRTRRIVVAGERQSVTALELAKMRLTRPAALAAELFKWKTDEDGAKASASGTVRGMFDEQRQGEDRVRIGLHERTDGQTVFGVWSRRRGHGRLMDSLGEKECSD
ncbi:hypothetical protein DENSPDRAFT_840915 [Dentipellis sp. KUC8613]|nr:hypothetical protein DENSPDRAFT_840915 [Dentipellis sp. KUC8613]